MRIKISYHVTKLDVCNLLIISDVFIADFIKIWFDSCF